MVETETLYTFLLLFLFFYFFFFWRASETLSGVTQLKIGDICLFIYVWTYVCHFDPRVFLCSLCVPPLPNFTKQNPPV